MNDETQPVQHSSQQPAAAPAQPEQPAAAPAQPEQPAQPAVAPRPRTALRDRVFGLRSVVAVAAAGLVLGGVGGAALGAVAGGDDDPGRGGFGRPQFQQGQNGQLPQFPGQQGQPGQPGPPPDGWLPPGTSPEQESVQPGGGGDTTSGSNT